MNEERIAQLKEFLRESPDDAFIKYALALEYVKANNPLAEEVFEELLSNHPYYLPTYYHAADYFVENEMIEKAKTSFEKGIELATRQNDQKAKAELQNAYQNFLFEID